MKMKRGMYMLCLMTCLLVVAIGARINYSIRSNGLAHVEIAESLRDMSLAYVDLPLGDTETMRDAVDRTLNYTSFVYRKYEFKDGPVFIYIGYWAPGKEPPRLVAAHTPDICWVVAGWSRIEDSDPPAWIKEATASRNPSFRTYSHSMTKQSVMFWHLIGNEQSQYGTSLEDFKSRHFWDDFRNGAFWRGPQAQLFIRISKEGTWQNWTEDPELSNFLREVATLNPALNREQSEKK